MRQPYKRFFESNKEYQSEFKESLTKWYITKEYENGEDKVIHIFNTFNKNEIQKIFDEEALKLEEGDELWFQKDDKKYIGEVIIIVVKRKGKLYREITKGSRTLYSPYKIKSGVN